MKLSTDWSAAYSVGNDSLDQQHQKLLSLCREAEALLENPDSQLSSKFQNVLAELCLYASEHFSEEEEILKAGNYPDFLAHKKLHDDYINDLSEILFSASKGKFETGKLHDFLNGWLVNHILGADMKYKAYFSKIQSQ